MVQLLLLKGAVLEAQDGVGRRAMHVAAQAGHVGLTGALLATGADAGARFGTYQLSALEVDAENGRAGVMKVLIEHGVNVNTANADGSTPLDCAAYGGSAQVIDALTKAGASINQKSVEGTSPLHVAAVWRRLQAARALLRCGAEVNMTNTHQRTPLFAVTSFPARHRAVEMVDLLKWGADEGMTDDSGRKPGQFGLAILDFGSIAQGVQESQRATREHQRVQQLFTTAPTDRAWRRHGLLVLCRFHPGRARWRQQVSEESGNMTAAKYSRARLVSKLVDEKDAANAQSSRTTAGCGEGDGALR
ncbi:ankyrin domain protein ank2 [Ectocarpus siliculosus]|uniref:Ankyrin domain protein ank2 n=1 Tax=Ectocarpus siliculosus TaxID=2880 RepID=D7FN29_ECTSI|nr:ankyrin domain protein ank2 [Ectocarpus siliculosus]|eukprot:CBJ30093.1 ankyrin domain protein ank2 [Ectocarpus siliculosus]